MSHSLRYVLRKGLSLNLELNHLAKLFAQRSPGIYLLVSAHLTGGINRHLLSPDWGSEPRSLDLWDKHFTSRAIFPAPKDLELLISCHHLPSAGLRSVGHQAWLILVNILCVRQWAEIVWLLSNLNVWFFFGQVSLNKIFVWMLNRHENRHACFCPT